MTNLLVSVLVGILGGGVGVLFMDLLWYRRFRAGGGTQSFMAWETTEGLESFEGAPAPARTAKTVAQKVGVDLPDSSARMVNNVVHWLTGLGWGAAHGVVFGLLGWSNPALGLATAVVAWGTSYAVLPRLGVYKPMREYEAKVLWDDLSAHLIFGAALGIVYWLIIGL